MKYSKKQIELLNSIGIIDYENIDWNEISMNQKLSENFIREFKDYVNWKLISANQTLSEDFICEFQNNIDWYWISEHQKLSEDFISEFKDKVNWFMISIYQKLSENFIREFKYNVDWYKISEYQKLTEDFIREFKYNVDWYKISEYQKLTEDFIRKFKDKVNWYRISQYQKLSPEFIKEFNITNFTFNENNWLYKTTEFKKKTIIDSGLYECYDDHFIAYKAIRTDRYSIFNFQYQYLPNQTYTAHCDHSNKEDSFGLSVWTEKGAKEYGKNNSLIVKVRVNYEDVGKLVHGSNKIRCSKIFIIN